MEDILKNGHIWHSLVMNTPYIIMIVDVHATILFINHTVPGLSPKEVTGKKLYDYIEPHFHAVTKKALGKVFSKGETAHYVLYGSGPHGTKSWYESVVSPIRRNQEIVAASIITFDVTQRKKTEEALSESERRFRVITDRSVDGIFSLDNNGYYTFVSPAVKRIAGYQPSEVLGKFFLDFIIQDDIPTAVTAFDDLTNRGIVECLELRIKKKDGSIGYVEINASPIIKEGEIDGVQGVVRDVSSRKKIEDELRNQSILTSALLNATTESIFLVDTNLRIITVNATGAKRLGKDPEEIIGKDGLTLISSDLAAYRKKFFDKAIRTGKPQRFQDQRGSHWFDANIFPVSDEDGKVKQLAVFARDITPEKKKEMLLQKSETKYRTIFESSPEGIVLLDSQGKFIDINGRLYDWLGYKKEEVIGKHFLDQPFFSDKTKAVLRKKFHQRISGENIPPYEIEIMSKTGALINGVVHGTLLYDERGNIIGDLVMISDISSLKALEKKIFEQEKMAALGRIAAVVSHELNTPLTNISLAAEMLSSSVSKKYNKNVEIIKSEVAQASDIIMRVLGFSRMDDLRYSTVNLEDVVKESIERVKKLATTSNVTFRIPKAFSIPMQGDERRLREVFINLLKNSLEAVDPQKKDNYISITGKISNDSAIVAIQDNGIGVDENLLEKITEAFFTTKPLTEGTGLGLTIAQWIIKQHGGTLSFKSKKNVGTTVTVTLPQKK